MPVVINSSLVSAQNRVRLYWSNIRTRQEGLFGDVHTDIPIPEDRGIFIQDILEAEVNDKYYIDSGVFGQDVSGKARSLRVGGGLSTDARHSWDVVKLDKKLRPKAQQGKASCLTAGGHSGGNHSDMDIIEIRDPWLRKNIRSGEEKACSLLSCSHKGYRANGMTIVLAVGSLRFFGETEFRTMKTMKSPCLKATQREDGNNQTVVELAVGTWCTYKEAKVCAMRGRGENNEQKIEERKDSKSNALTSVCKDNLVLGAAEATAIPGTWRTHKVDGGFREMAGDKSPCIPARARNDGSGQPCVRTDRVLRRLTPTECSRLQTIPEWYKWECSDTQAYKMLGNGWTVEVIKHILSFLDN